jgi:hypothetical protein
MQLLSLIAFVASATALAVPTPDLEERATCANANVLGLARAKREFTEAKLVPDLVPEFKPTLELYVDYNGKAVDFGNTFNTLGKSSCYPRVPDCLNYTINTAEKAIRSRLRLSRD